MKTDNSFSVVIPHKDNPVLLQRCLDSIPVRDDVQVIVVDDNSNPQLVDFSDFPGRNKYNTTIIFNKENRGAGYARNLGMELAKGRWLVFADADDYFQPGAFDHFAKHVNSQADIIYFGVCSRYSDTGKPADRADYFQELLHGYTEGDMQSEYWLRLRHLVPWGKMFRKDLIAHHNIFFEEVIASNDIMFSALAGSKASSIAKDPSVVYCVTVNKGSLTNTRSQEIALARFQVKLRYNDLVRAIGKPQYQYTVRRELYDSFQYGWKEFWRYFRMAKQHQTDFFFELNLKRALKSLRHYKQEEKNKKKFIVRK